MHACTHTHMQSAHTGCLPAHMIGNTNCGLHLKCWLNESSGQNHFRRSQQRINTVILINWNRISFIPVIIIALFPSSLSNPASPFLLLLFLHSLHSWLTLSSASYCMHPSPLWPHFPFCKPVHHFVFLLYVLSPPKSDTSFKRESFSGKYPRHGSASCFCWQHLRDASYRSSLKQSP